MNRIFHAGMLGLSLFVAGQSMGQDADLQAQIDAAQAAAEAATLAAEDAQAKLAELVAQAEDGKAADPNEPEQPADAADLTGIFSGWKSRFEAGLNGSDGNTEKASLYLSVVSSRETTSSRQQFDASYIHGMSDGDQDVGKGTIGLRNDWLFDEKPYFLFADGRADYDRFQAWEYRASGFLGAGYDWIKKDNYSLTLLGGLGITREFNSPNNEIRPEGMLGTDVGWAITENQDLTYKFRLYPDLDDGGEFRLTNDVAWVIALPDMENANLSLGVKQEYDSHAEKPTEKNDIYYYVAIGFDF